MQIDSPIIDAGRPAERQPPFSAPGSAPWRNCLRYSVYLYALSSPLSIAATNMSWCLAAICLAALSWKNRRLPLPAPTGLSRALWLYLGVAFITSALGIEPRVSFAHFSSDAHKLWLYHLWSTALAIEPAPKALIFLGIGFSLSSLWGVGQTVHAYATESFWDMARGGVHHITYGEQLAFALLGAVAFFTLFPRYLKIARNASGVNGAPAAQHADPRIFWALCGFCLLGASAFICSQTRGAWVGFTISLLGLFALYPFTLKTALKIAPAFILIFVFLLPQQGIHELEKRGASIFDVNENSSRLALWDVALRIHEDHPLSGVGPNNYRKSFQFYHPGRLDHDRVWGTAHNLYLHHLAERGYLGLLSLLLIVLASLTRSWKNFRSRPNYWSLWILLVVPAFWIMNITEVAWGDAMVWMLFLFLWNWAYFNSQREPPVAI